MLGGIRSGLVAAKRGSLSSGRSARRSRAPSNFGTLVKYSTRAHRLEKEGYDAPGPVVGDAVLAPVEPAYADWRGLEDDIRALLESRVPIETLRELGKKKLTGRAAILWANHVHALERKLATYSKELFNDLSLYQLQETETKSFGSWALAVRELFRLTQVAQEREERLRRDSQRLTSDPTSIRDRVPVGLAAQSTSEGAPASSLAPVVTNLSTGLSYDKDGFPLLGANWQISQQNRNGEFKWIDQPQLVIAVKSARTSLQPANTTGASGNKQNYLLHNLEAAPATVLLERLMLVDFARRKLIMSERVERADAGHEFDPSVRHLETWQAFTSRLNSLFDAPMPTVAEAEPATAASVAEGSASTASAASPSKAHNLVTSILMEGDRLHRPIVEQIENLMQSIREEIRVVEQLAVNADTGAPVPASLPMSPADVDALIQRVKSNTLSQGRLLSSGFFKPQDRMPGFNQPNPAFGQPTLNLGAQRGAAVGNLVTGVPAKLPKEAERQLQELKTSLVQLLEVLASKVGVSSASLARRATRDEEAGIVRTAARTSALPADAPPQAIPGTSGQASGEDGSGLPRWRQRVYTIPPGLLLSLKQVSWPRSQHEVYEQDRAALRRYKSDFNVAVGLNNSWTDHIQQLRKVLGPDIADLSSLAAMNEAAAAAAAAVAAAAAKPTSPVTSTTTTANKENGAEENEDAALEESI